MTENQYKALLNVCKDVRLLLYALLAVELIRLILGH